MLRFALNRVLQSVLLLLLLSFLVFTLFQLIPGDYLSEMEMNPAISSHTVDQLRSQYGLNQSLIGQYGSWMAQLARGNLGFSFAQQQPAAPLILDRLMRTAMLAGSALLLSLVVSIPLAVLSAIHAGRRLDTVILWLSVTSLSLPAVLTSLFFLYFAFWSGWFPLGGTEGFKSLILPTLTLALPGFGFFVRILRLELIDALDQPYILAAAARGLTRRRILYHALRNAANPLISILGASLGGLLGGSVVVEKVFRWPGLGALTVDSILSRDLYVALNCVLVASLLVIAANLLADLMLAWNDPRIRYGEES